MNRIMKSVKGITNIVVPLLTLAILLSLLVAGLIALGVILHLLQDGWCSCDESS